MKMVVVTTWNSPLSSLVSLIKGLCSSNPYGIDKQTHTHTHLSPVCRMPLSPVCQMQISSSASIVMGWLRLVGSTKL